MEGRSLRSTKIMDAWENLSPEERKGRTDNQEDVSNEELLELFIYVIDSE